MGDIKIRKLDENIISKLDELAKKKKISREEYLRKILASHAIAGDVMAVELKYETLIAKLMERFEYQNEILDRNSMLMQLLYEKL